MKVTLISIQQGIYRDSIKHPSAQMAKSKVLKRAVKLLKECKDPSVRSAFLNGAPDTLVKTICTAVFTVEGGDKALNKRQ